MTKNYADRRKFIRLDTVLPVEFRILNSTGQILLDWTQGFTNNIGKGGICLTINNIKEQAVLILEEKSAKFYLRINLPLKDKPIECYAKTAWLSKVKKEPFNQFLVGLDYEEIVDSDRQRLLDFAKFKKNFSGFLALFVIALCAVTIFSGIYNYKQYEKNKKLVFSLLENLKQISSLETQLNNIGQERTEVEVKIKNEKERNSQLEKRISFLQRPAKVTLSTEKKAAADKELFDLKKELELASLEKETLEQKLFFLTKTQTGAQAKLDILKKENMPLKKEVAQKMYHWLVVHQNQRTGLVSSFEGDSALKDGAFIYDQALAALAFTVNNEFDKAKKMFSFFEKAKRTNGAFYNAYYATSGDVMEYTVHAGPNLWVGIAIAQYVHKTKDTEFLPLVEEIAAWVIKLQNEDSEKGIRGGPEATWYSTEHNLDAYAFFNMLYKITNNKKYSTAAENTLNWLKKFAYSNSALPVNRGKGDSTIATDTYAWSIASIGPELLRSTGMDPDKIVEFAEENCLVNVDYKNAEGSAVAVKGFDFAKAEHIARGGVISCEWTAQMVLTYRIMSDFYKKLGVLETAQKYSDKARMFLSELDKLIICSPSAVGQGEGCLPYASQEYVDTGHGWMTPKGKQTGSLSSTAYAFFAYIGFNPLSLNGQCDL